MLTNSNNHGGNLAHGTLGHVMTAHVMGLNIQCQCPSNLILSKTNVQYEIFYLNLTKGEWMWYGRETKPKSRLA